MNKVVEKTMGNGVDNKHLNIIDYAPERSIRVYPYVAFRANDSKAIIENQAVSIVGLNQTDLEANGIKTLIDENGKNYIEVLGLRSKEGKIDISKPTSSVGVQIKYETSLDAITQTMPTKRRMKPIFVTVDEPFNKEQYEAGNQPVFLMGTILPMDDFNDEFPDYDEESATQFKLTNVTVIEQQFQVARMLFDPKAQNIGDINVNIGTTDAPKIVSGFQIDIDKSALIKRIFAKGKLKGSNSDVDLTTNEKLTPFKGTVIDIDGKLSLFADWFDYDLVMPEYIAKLFTKTGGISLDALKQVKIKNITSNPDATVAEDSYFRDEEINLIIDMMAISYAYASQFKDFERISTGSEAGKLDPKQVIGSTNIRVYALENKDPIKAIDGLFETYIRKFHITQETPQLKAVRAIIAGLSRFIYSSYAISKGQNSFNEVFLPWYIRPVTAIELKKGAKTTIDNVDDTTPYTLSTTTQFELGSRYFDITNGVIVGEIKLKSGFDISTTQVVQTDRKISLPFLDSQITPTTKLPLAGDIRTTSADDLKYIWYMAVTKDEDFQKLFLNDPSVTTENKNVEDTISEPWSEWGKNSPLTGTATPDQVVKYYLSKHPLIPAMNVAISQKPNALGDVIYETNQNVHHISERKKMGTTSTPSNGHSPISGSQLASEYGLSNVEIFENNSYSIVYGGSNNQYTVEWEVDFKYREKRSRRINMIVVVNGRVNTIDTNRDPVFDKTGWKYFLYDTLGIGNTPATFNLLEKYNMPIENVYEIWIEQIWADNISLRIGTLNFDIPVFNNDDETIGIQKILFT